MLTVRFVAIAVALLVIYNSGPAVFEALGVSLLNGLGIRLIVGGTLLGAAANGYNSGLVVSWLIAGLWLLPLAFGFALSDSPIGGPRSFAGQVSIVFSTMVLYGLLVGTIGFLLGVGGRRLRQRLTKRDTDS